MAIKIEVNKNIQNINSIQAESLTFQTTTLEPKLLELIESIIMEIKNDKSLNEIKIKETIDDIKILLRELQLKNPRKGIIKSIISSLGNFSSIVAFIDKLYPFLPKF